MKLTEKEKESARDFFDFMIGGSNICNRCIHKDVCKHIDDSPKKECEFYIYRASPKRHGDISTFFEPIFEWLRINYPSGGVTFRVEQDHAQMLLEHSVSVYSKRLSGCCCIDPKCASDSEKEEK